MIYNRKPLQRNLYHFFIEAQLQQIRLPIPADCIQSFYREQNIAKAEVFGKYPNLFASLNERERMIIASSDCFRAFSGLLGALPFFDRHSDIRLELRIPGIAHSNNKIHNRVRILNASRKGFCLGLPDEEGHHFSIGDRLKIRFNLSGEEFDLAVKLRLPVTLLPAR